VETTAAIMALGIEQEFFVVRRDVVRERLDLKTLGRTLIGKLPPKHQQFADHYYGKLPNKIEKVLGEAEEELI
jgi:glutamine synthetase